MHVLRGTRTSVVSAVLQCGPGHIHIHTAVRMWPRVPEWWSEWSDVHTRSGMNITHKISYNVESKKNIEAAKHNLLIRQTDVWVRGREAQCKENKHFAFRCGSTTNSSFEDWSITTVQDTFFSCISASICWLNAQEVFFCSTVRVSWVFLIPVQTCLFPLTTLCCENDHFMLGLQTQQDTLLSVLKSHISKFPSCLTTLISPPLLPSLSLSSRLH